ncbi:MAG: hypothetical protein H7039_20855 [Bryobacteraceae bacterium]|nr:hypothetical protein [Bryobacteraceae bacterium]
MIVRLPLTATLAILSMLAYAGDAPQSPVRDKPEQIGFSNEFVGWRGESAVFRRERYLSSGQMQTSSYALGVRGRSTAPGSKTWKLYPGTILLQDYTASESSPSKISFELDADPARIRALEEEMTRWSEQEAPKLPASFPQVPAALRILLEDQGSKRVVWEQKRKLTASPGENGFRFEPPRLRFAALSKSGATLLVELISSEGSEFVRIALQQQNGFTGRPRR